MKTFHSHLLLTALRLAYTAAIRGLKLANTLKDKQASKLHRSRIMSRMNKIRAEILRTEKASIVVTKPVIVKQQGQSMAYPILKRWGVVC
jgi:hypothetical protein